VALLSLQSRVGQILARLLNPWVFLPVVAVTYFGLSLLALNQTLQDPKGRADLVSGDAMHYLDIAQDFAHGNLTMDYVQSRPHRQPLYPAALAPVYWWKGQDFFWLCVINILFATLGLLVVYGATLFLFKRRGVSALVALLYLNEPFLAAQTTRHFMTEPLHIFLLCGVIAGLLFYFRDGRWWVLLATCAGVGLDYLTRPNGLFVMFALMAVVALRDLVKYLKSRQALSVRALARRALLYSAAIGVFGFVTMPSWVPRLRDFGSPFYHGYLSNYLWVDTYAEGHVGQREAKYHWQDYVANHSARDAVKRMAWGIGNVGFVIPFRTQPHFPVLFILAWLGVVTAFIKGPSCYRWLALFAIIQLLPLVWTNLSNPTIRVPFASTLPFELFFAGLLLSCLAISFPPAWMVWAERA